LNTPKEAEDIFRNALQEVEEISRKEEKVRNVFISFHIDDESQVNLLRSHLDSPKY